MAFQNQVQQCPRGNDEVWETAGKGRAALALVAVDPSVQVTASSWLQRAEPSRTPGGMPHGNVEPRGASASRPGGHSPAPWEGRCGACERMSHRAPVNMRDGPPGEAPHVNRPGQCPQRGAPEVRLPEDGAKALHLAQAPHSQSVPSDSQETQVGPGAPGCSPQLCPQWSRPWQAGGLRAPGGSGPALGPC